MSPNYGKEDWPVNGCVTTTTDDCSSRLQELEVENVRLLVERDAAERALGVLRSIAEEAESLNAGLACGEVTLAEARVRVQNIHGLAVSGG